MGLPDRGVAASSRILAKPYGALIPIYISASEGPKFAAVAREMTDRACKLGPNPVKVGLRAAWLAQPPEATAAAC